MQYKCINNLNKFSFRDAFIEQCSMENGTFTLNLSGLVARYNNPSNDTLVDRYVGESSVRFMEASIKKIALEGVKYYTADDELVEAVPDTIYPESDYPDLVKKMEHGTLFAALENKIQDDQYEIELAIDLYKDEEDEIPDTYWFTLSYAKAITEWDQFMNRATVE